MPLTTTPAEERVLLENASWEDYERVLAEHPHSPGTRIAYDEGLLEIMVVYLGHEMPNRLLALLAETVARETGKDFCPSGSTTFKRKDLKKGFEPDSSFYIEHADAVENKNETDMAVDPPPDLIIEVDITRSSLNRFRIYAGIGVPEVWRFDGDRVIFYRLRGGRYEEVEASVVLPPMSASQATVFLARRRKVKQLAWEREIREWVRTNR